MSAQRISILGTESSGKTVLLGALTHALSSTANYPRITAENVLTKRYTAGIMDALETGKWPASTATGVRQNLRWLWHDKNKQTHELRTFDCAGQDFRAIFESEADSELTSQQLTLKQNFFQSDLVLLLFNLQPALELHGVPGKNTARLELSYAPAAAIRKLRAAGVDTYVLFTQADRYATRLQNEWSGDLANALGKLLPDLCSAIHESGSQALIVNAIETEERDGALLPKIGHKPHAIETLVESIDNFLIHNQPIAQQRAAEKQAEEERQRQQELEARQQRAEAEQQRAEAELQRIKARLRNGATVSAFGKKIHLALSNDASLTLLFVAAGSFLMGSESGNADEKPVRKVTITEPFWLGETVITNAQWNAIMGSSGSGFTRTSRRPECVSWRSAISFCEKLMDLAICRLPIGYKLALPTEAQWEYACRAGTTGEYAGTGMLDDMGWYAGNRTSGPCEVAKKQPNAWGFYDMHGNVWEWCADCYDSNYYAKGDMSDPKGAEMGGAHVFRGGSFCSFANSCRSTYRGCKSTFFRNIGFRLALVPL
jgi:formylglycine-generating enzyme required for sulfatase activity